MRLAIAIVLAAFVAACATPTQYRAAQFEGDEGYSEVRIEADRYRVTFEGNTLTDLDRVQNLTLLRAAELTLLEGFDWFEIVGSDTDTERTITRTGDPFHGRSFYFHPRFGWYSRYDPFWDRYDVQEATRFRVSVEIELGNNPAPERPRVYDARDVELNIRPLANTQ